MHHLKILFVSLMINWILLWYLNNFHTVFFYFEIVQKTQIKTNKKCKKNWNFTISQTKQTPANSAAPILKNTHEEVTEYEYKELNIDLFKDYMTKRD